MRDLMCSEDARTFMSAYNPAVAKIRWWPVVSF